MIFLSFIIGLFVIKFKPNYNMKTVFESNARYYPHINDDTVLKKVAKPQIVIPVQPEDTQENITVTPDGAHKPAAGKPITAPERPKQIQKKINSDEFIPD